MLKRSIASLSTCAVLLLTAVTSWAQNAVEIQVDVKDVKLSQTYTPQFQGSNIVDKRWKPKPWLEVDMALEIKRATSSQDKSAFVDELEVKVFVALNKQSPNNKMYLLTASQAYVNASVKDANRVLLYASPKALSRLLDKDFYNNDVKAVGIEVYHGGNLVGGHSSAGGKFWETAADSFETVDKVLLPKVATPFAPLWGDYDLEAKQ